MTSMCLRGPRVSLCCVTVDVPCFLAFWLLALGSLSALAFVDALSCISCCLCLLSLVSHSFPSASPCLHITIPISMSSSLSFSIPDLPGCILLESHRPVVHTHNIMYLYRLPISLSFPFLSVSVSLHLCSTHRLFRAVISLHVRPGCSMYLRRRHAFTKDPSS